MNAPIANVCIAIFHSYLTIAPSIDCNSDVYLNLRATASVAIVFYLLGIPVVLLWLQYRVHSLFALSAPDFEDEPLELDVLAALPNSARSKYLISCSAPSAAIAFDINPESSSSSSIPSLCPKSVNWAPDRDSVFEKSSALLSSIASDNSSFEAKLIVPSSTDNSSSALDQHPPSFTTSIQSARTSHFIPDELLADESQQKFDDSLLPLIDGHKLVSSSNSFSPVREQSLFSSPAISKKWTTLSSFRTSTSALHPQSTSTSKPLIFGLPAAFWQHALRFLASSVHAVRMLIHLSEHSSNFA